jgi:hypothetical protein
MHTIEIPEEKLLLYIPSNLGECDEQQYIDMCELIYLFQSGQISYEDMRVMAVYRLLNLEPSKKELLIPDQENKLSNVYQISLLVDNFFEDKEGKKIIKQDYTRNPVPAFRPLWVHYYGPADTFTNITFGEYTDGLRLFMEFSATGNLQLLYLLAAVFYRKKKWFHWVRKHLNNYNGDIREPYNSDILEARAHTFKVMPIGFIYGVYLYFASFQKFITSATVPWAGRELDFSVLFDDGTSDTMEAVPGIGMDSLVFSLAESSRFGSMEGVRSAKLWEVLILLYDLRKQDLDYKLNDKISK